MPLRMFSPFLPPAAMFKGVKSEFTPKIIFLMFLAHKNDQNEVSHMKIRSQIRKLAFSPLLPPPSPFLRGVKSEFPQRQRWGKLRGAQRVPIDHI